ncbi:Aldo-ket-red domain-containing protein [Mycena kentingensis (nom. inval.)]|nr:Aldo-ket-red domain-containing protein [Mycena kentingensis (nom. inval.)]
MSLPTFTIGNKTFGAIGFGAMGIGLSLYGAVESDEDRFKVLDAAYEAGCTMWDTAQIYGDSEELIGKWFKRTGKRDEIFLATKGGIGADFSLDGSRGSILKSATESLEKLGVNYIDLYYLHRPDPNVPIEVSISAIAELVKAGKVKHLGLSEVSASTLCRAYAVHPIATVECEYSTFTLDIEDPKIDLLRTARELGVKIVSYSPLGRGLVTGQYKSPADFAADDFRRWIPRYSEANFPNILRLADGLKTIGAKYSTASGPATGGQVGLAWLLAQGDVIPIPGTKKIKFLHENLAAKSIKLSEEDLATVRALAVEADKVGQNAGPRYPPGMAEQLFAETPAL